MTTARSEVASDSGHYYYPDGSPAYTVIGKNGRERNTTIADCRRLGLVPSVTEVLKMLPKPGLIQWQKKNVLMSALTLTRLPDEPDDAYIARIMADADEQARVAREKGTSIHGAIERFIQGEHIETEYAVHVRPAMSALTEHLGLEHILDKCEVEKSYADTDLGYGGKVDLHSKELNLVLDFKTKEFDEDTKQLAWDDQKIQLHAYAKGLGMPSARLINVYISTSVPGLVRVVEHVWDDRYWDMFAMCLKLWRLVKNYI